jgi:zinc protease
MAVIVVGDINPAATVGMIRSHFSSLAAPSPTRPRPIFDVPEHPGTKYTIVTDQETTATSVALSNLRPARRQDTVGGYRDIMRDQLFGDMLDARLEELMQSDNPPFLRVAASRQLFQTPRTKDEAVLEALVPNNGVATGLEALLTELHRVERFGFTETELARAKQARLLSYETKRHRESRSRIIEPRRRVHAQFPPGRSVAHDLAGARVQSSVRAGDHAGRDQRPHARLVPRAEPPRDRVRPRRHRRHAAERDAAGGGRQGGFGQAPRGVRRHGRGEVPHGGAANAWIDRRDATHAQAGITEWTLSNGATVVIKPTTLREDQILFRATAAGGTSLASDADFISARSADDVIGAGGVGRFSPTALDRVLAGRSSRSLRSSARSSRAWSVGARLRISRRCFS